MTIKKGITMNRKKETIIILITLLALLFQPDAQGCTSAIISADMNPSGRPLLWKHRDTSNIDNKVEYVEGSNGEYSFVALFNAGDKRLAEAWMGMNVVGFAIMNTASYNIKDDKVAASKMDKEGFVMTKALKHCRTVDDFARLLSTLPRPMGVEANFGVIDASGNGAYFETNNHSFKRFDLKDAENGVLVRTNYSHSGRKNEGFGFVREANANILLEPFIKNKSVTPEVLTEVLSRSFYHDLQKKDFSDGSQEWVVDQDFIPRYKSTATVVIEGCRPVENVDDVKRGELSDEYIMWTGLGYPPCSEIVPVWCKPDGVEKSLRGLNGNGHSERADRAKQRRDDVFPLKKGNGEKYIDMLKLYNDEGTGYVQTLVPQNLEVYRIFKEKRDSRVK